MNANTNNIPTKFFGLNKQDVNKHFQELSKKYEAELEKLLKQKKLLERELGKLSAELNEESKEIVQHEDEVIAKTDEKSSELLRSAVDRLQKTKNIIDMVADEEIEQIRRNANEKLIEHEETIKRLQSEIEESKNKIESTLSKVTQVIKSNMSDMEEDNSDIPLDKRLKDIKVAIKLADNLAVNKDQEKITADGTSLSYINKISKFKKKYMPSFLEEEEEDELAEELSKKNKKNKRYDNILNYDIDDNIDDDYSVKALLDEIMLDEDDEIKEEPIEQSESNDSNIKDMRNALIIGKVAGEDLQDNENNIIVPKNKVLTQEDVELAEKAGKLPELIINMALPE